MNQQPDKFDAGAPGADACEESSSDVETAHHSRFYSWMAGMLMAVTSTPAQAEDPLLQEPALKEAKEFVLRGTGNRAELGKKLSTLIPTQIDPVTKSMPPLTTNGMEIYGRRLLHQQREQHVIKKIEELIDDALSDPDIDHAKQIRAIELVLQLGPKAKGCIPRLIRVAGMDVKDPTKNEPRARLIQAGRDALQQIGPPDPEQMQDICIIIDQPDARAWYALDTLISATKMNPLSRTYALNTFASLGTNPLHNPTRVTRIRSLLEKAIALPQYQENRKAIEEFSKALGK